MNDKTLLIVILKWFFIFIYYKFLKYNAKQNGFIFIGSRCIIIVSGSRKFECSKSGVRTVETLNLFYFSFTTSQTCVFYIQLQVQCVVGVPLYGYGLFSLKRIGSVMFVATFNLVARVGLPYFLEHWKNTLSKMFNHFFVKKIKILYSSHRTILLKFHQHVVQTLIK